MKFLISTIVLAVPATVAGLFTPFLTANGVLNLRPPVVDKVLTPLGSIGSICSSFTINGLKKSTCDKAFQQVADFIVQVSAFYLPNVLIHVPIDIYRGLSL